MKKYEFTQYEFVKVRVDHKPSRRIPFSNNVQNFNTLALLCRALRCDKASFDY